MRGLSGLATWLLEHFAEPVIEAPDPRDAQIVQLREKVAELEARISSRRRMPDRHHSKEQKLRIGGAKMYVGVGEYDNGELGEVFVDAGYDMPASFASLMNCFAISISVGLQHGVPLEKFVDLFTYVRFDPAGPVEGHPRVKMSTSMIDLLFRLVALEYLDRQEFAQIPEDEAEAEKDEE